MRSSTSFALFAGAAAAQSMSVAPSGANAVAVFNLFEYAPTLTFVASDATATTYKNVCSGSAGLPSEASSHASEDMTQITPAPKPRALHARQAMTDSPDDAAICEPYTITQGASTWEMHLTDPTPGMWTVGMNCNWKGAMTAADFTCIATVDGAFVMESDRGTSSTMMPSDMVKDFEAINTVAIVGASGVDVSATPVSSGASPTASGSAASGSAASGSSASGSAAARSGSGTASPSPSTGFAPTRPLPTGAMALVGGAAGVFAAALAL